MSLIKDNLYDILNINLRIISDICLNILAIKRKNKICGHNLFFVSTFLDKVKTIIVLRERERGERERERERETGKSCSSFQFVDGYYRYL